MGRRKTRADTDPRETGDEKPLRVPDGEAASKRYFCYILECSDGTFYTGWSTNPERRARQHNRGTGARYTRSRRPVRVVYVEEQPDIAAAMKRERAIKSLSREQKKRLMQKSKINL